MPKKFTDAKRPSLTEEMAELDQRLVKMVAQRSRLLARAAAARREKRLPMAEAAQEKRLWADFERAARKQDLPPSLARKLFILMNSMGYALAEQPDRVGKPFFLGPGRDPAAIDLPGPASSAHARIMAAVAAACGEPTELSPLFISDPVVELVKASNQLSGGLRWEGQTLSAEASEPLSFDGKTVFVGHDPFTFCLLLALALPEPVRCRFSGGSSLKLLDLSRISGVLVGLGARLAPIDRKAPGLPARLESGGPMGREVDVPADAPEGLAAALAAAAWSYPRGADIAYVPDSPAARHLEAALWCLTAMGVPHEATPGRVKVEAAEPQIPARPILPLDAEVSAYLLAIPRFTGGSVRLSGRLDPDGATTARASELMAAAGVEISRAPGETSTRAGDWPEKPTFTPAETGLLPLACALALACPGGGDVVLPGDEETAFEAEHVLTMSGAEVSSQDGVLSVKAASMPEEPVDAPSALWAMGLALAARRMGRFPLANPGVMGELWPGFFSFMNRVDSPGETLFPEKEQDEPEDKPTRRRFRVR